MKPFDLHMLANTSGKLRAKACTPEVMVVNGVSYAQGVCGFAWVVFAGNTSFGKYMLECGLASKRYGSPGLSMWISEYGQSYEKKRAYAQGYASVLQAHGLKSHSGSRMD